MVTVGYHQASALVGTDGVRSIHNGIDIEAFPFCSQPDDYLLFLGRLVPNKGADIAIQTAKALGQPLIIAGPSNNDHRAYFEEKIMKEVDDQLIRYGGPVGGAQKLELLRKAKGLLFPVQWDEPFGLVMVESMACGTPVVALRRGAVPEIIDPGVNGFYADQPEDLPILARRLTELDRLEVRRSVEAKFSHHRMVADYLALYREILDRRGELQAT